MCNVTGQKIVTSREVMKHSRRSPLPPEPISAASRTPVVDERPPGIPTDASAPKRARPSATSVPSPSRGVPKSPPQARSGPPSDARTKTLAAASYKLPSSKPASLKPSSRSAPSSNDFVPRPVSSDTGPSAAFGARSPVGRIIGDRYQVGAFIARGASSTIWSCVDLKLGRPLALKLGRSASHLGARARDRFYQEAKVLGMLGHPSICAVDAVGQLDDGTPYLVMELLKGMTLRQRLDTAGPLTLEETCLVGIQVLEVLALTHALRVLHRDIKPANIFFCTGAQNALRVKVLDFGISKQLSAEAVRLTPTGFVMGTPLYLAPEQTTSRKVDQRADLYSVGLVLHESITGSPPFTASTYEALLKKIRDEGVPPIEKLAPWVPPALAAVINRATDRDRRMRFPSATSMHSALFEVYRSGIPRYQPILRQARTLPAPPPEEAVISSGREQTTRSRK